MWPFGKRQNEPAQPESAPHHYFLAHVAFRKICQNDPLLFFTAMASPDREEFLRNTWQSVCATFDSPEPAPFDIADVAITTRRIKNYPAIVVAMPPPSAVPQAHFVAIVLMIDGEADAPPEEVEVRYFTLERGAELDGMVKTVLGGWKGDMHLNYGIGPQPTQDAFIAAVEEILQPPPP